MGYYSEFNLPLVNCHCHAPFEEGLGITKNLLDKYKNHPLVKVSVAPHSIYTVSAQHLIEAKKLADKGAASSNRLDIWEAGKYEALLQKVANLGATVLPVKKIIEMMTVNGMKALDFNSLNNADIKEWKKESKRTISRICIV